MNERILHLIIILSAIGIAILISYIWDLLERRYLK